MDVTVHPVSDLTRAQKLDFSPWSRLPKSVPFEELAPASPLNTTPPTHTFPSNSPGIWAALMIRW